MYKDGLGVTKNHELSLLYTKKAALLGVPSAAYNVGKHYMNKAANDKETDAEFEQNATKAYAWFKVSEILGQETAMKNGKEIPISELLEMLSSFQKEHFSIQEADELTLKICSDIITCVP